MQAKIDISKLLEMADNSPHFFISEFFGNIPIVSTSDEDVYTTAELRNIDLSLNEEVNFVKKCSDRSSALSAYTLAFSNLNKANEPLSTPIYNKTFVDYFMESVSHNLPVRTDKTLPRLLFVSDDLVHQFLSDNHLNHHKNGVTLKDEKIILISIDKKNDFHDIARTMIHQLQYIYNAHFISEDEQEDCSKHLSDYAISLFMKHTRSLKFDNAVFLEIAEEMFSLLKSLAAYEQKDRDLDNLSAHLTALLFLHPETYIREVGGLIFSKIAELPSQTRGKDEALLVCRFLSKALLCIENTIDHSARALRNFKANTPQELFDAQKEFLDANCGNEPFIDVLRKSLKEIIDNPWKIVSSDEPLKEYFKIEQANGELVGALSDVNPDYSLSEQVKLGNNAMVKYLLQISKANINRDNNDGYSLLASAVMHKQLHTFHLLLQFGASLKWQGKVGDLKNGNLLNLAAHSGHFEFISILLNYFPVTAAMEKQDAENDLYLSLIHFRKNFAVLHLLFTNNLLKNVPEEIFYLIVLQFNDDILNKEMIECLSKDKQGLNQFITLGMQAAYNDFPVIPIELSAFDAIKKKWLALIGLDEPSIDTQCNLRAQDKKKEVSAYYSPRSLFSSATSLSAVTFAQKELRAKSDKPFFQEDRYAERRLAISQWKTKAEKNEDKGLSRALMQVFKDMDIDEINSDSYHKLSTILAKLVIQHNKTPDNYSPKLFVKAVKSRYQASLQCNDKFNLR